MSKLQLGNWEQRPYGEKAEGVVVGDDRNIKVAVRRPSDGQGNGTTYVMANGWTAGMNSMRVPAIEAVKSGYTAVTFKYSNTGSREALRHNVTDVTTLIETLPANERKRAIGLSMGGAVVTMALERVGSEVESATLVAPGKYLHAHYYSRTVIARHMIAEAAEIGRLQRNVRTSMHLLADGAVTCASRPQAVLAELRELLDGNVHEELWRVKSKPDAPYIRFMYGLKDPLLPAEAQRDSIIGLPFDHVLPYSGGHVRLAHDPTLSREIFFLDELNPPSRAIA